MAWTFLPNTAQFFRFKNWCKITSPKKCSVTQNTVFSMSKKVWSNPKLIFFVFHQFQPKYRAFSAHCEIFAKCCGQLYCSCPRPDNRHNCGCDECPDSADYQWSRAFFPTVLFDWASKIIHAHNMGIPWYSLCIDKWNLQANTLNPHNGSITYLDCSNHRRKWFLFTPTAQ